MRVIQRESLVRRGVIKNDKLHLVETYFVLPIRRSDRPPTKGENTKHEIKDKYNLFRFNSIYFYVLFQMANYLVRKCVLIPHINFALARPSKPLPGRRERYENLRNDSK